MQHHLLEKVLIVVDQDQSSFLSTARTTETANGRIKGHMTGSRPRASTMREGVFTVSLFSLQSNMQICRF